MEGLDEEVEEVVCPRKKCPLWRATEYSKEWTPGNQESEYNDPSFIHPSTQSVIQSIQWESVSHSPRAMSFFFRFRGGIRFLTYSEEGGHRSSILIGRVTSNPCPVVLTRTVCGYCIIFPRVTNSIPAFDWLTDWRDRTTHYFAFKDSLDKTIHWHPEGHPSSVWAEAVNELNEFRPPPLRAIEMGKYCDSISWAK